MLLVIKCERERVLAEDSQRGQADRGQDQEEQAFAPTELFHHLKEPILLQRFSR